MPATSVHGRVYCTAKECSNAMPYTSALGMFPYLTEHSNAVPVANGLLVNSGMPPFSDVTARWDFPH